ncbi:MAG: glycosyltransferase family 4 protein [Candidatus Omnitrophota bacterium]
MHLIIITEVFFPDRIGGAGRYVYSLAKGLVTQGHKVTVIARQLNALSFRQDIEAIEVFRADWEGVFFGLRPFVYPFSLQRIFREIEKYRSVDGVIFNQPFSTFSLLGLKEIKNLKKIYIFHSSWADELRVMRGYGRLAPAQLLLRDIEQAVLRRIPRIVVLSEFSRNRIVELYGIDKEKITVIPSGVDTDKFQPGFDKPGLRHKFGLPQEAFILFTVRNLVPRMGLDNLIVAFAKVVKQFPSAYLIIAGGGFLKKDLKSLAGKLGLSARINFTGPLKEEILRSYYQAADLFILPTRCLEGFGLVTLEALACGLPVLGTPVGATPEILNKFDPNFLFPGADPASLAAKIIEFIGSGPDLAQLSKSCREFVLREYSQEKWLNQMEAIFRSG